MKRKQIFFTLLLLSIHGIMQAQCDPWITKAYQELYRRTPTAAECNIKNYNNGSWRSYDELAGHIKAFNAPVILKGDPWIFELYNQLYRRQPSAWELNISNYNNGSWESKEELKKYIQDYQASVAKASLVVRTAPLKGGKVLVGFYLNGQQIVADVVSADAGKILAQGGNIISQDGGSLISPNGGTLINGTTGNIISQDGGSISISQAMAGASFGNLYVQAAAGTRVVPTSGKGALLIR